MLSIHRLSAGEGYRYLLRHTAAGDVDRDPATSLTSYYAASGYPPGRWLGSGLTGLGDGRLRAGSEVTEAQMAHLYGQGLDPVTGAPLGRPYRVYRTWRDRVAARVKTLDEALSPGQRTEAVARIEAEERARRTRTAVAGFDLTFSPVKSVSALWAIADPATQDQVVAAHHEAIDDVVAVMEREVAFTRTGEGGIAQLDTKGLVAAGFDHWDTRAGDPQLHTHLVVANRVQGPDGRWRALDARGLYAATVALSETYNTLLADKLTARLGVDWEHRERGADRNPAFEITCVPQPLLEEFSARTAQIEHQLGELVAEHRARTGHEPGRRDMYLLRQQATLLDRPVKQTPVPLEDLVAGWRERAETVLGHDPRRVVQQAVARSRRRPLTAAEVDESTVAGYAATVVLGVQTKRATWNRWNILAEAARQTRALSMATAEDRLRLLDRVTEQALAESVSLTVPELVQVPDRFRRADGEDVFSVHHTDRYTSATMLGAEAYLLDRAATTTGPTIGQNHRDQPLQAVGSAHRLDDDQADAVRRIAASGRALDVLVGAAGAGKTTTLRALRAAWEAEHGAGSVLGLAPSAAAAQVLAERLGVGTDNTAKWLHESTGPGAAHRADTLTHWQTVADQADRQGRQHRAREARRRAQALRVEQDRWRLAKNQLVVLDEASLDGTLTLATLARQAEDAGAKVLLVGDDAQLSAVDAGGAFRLLARETHAAELTGIWRFSAGWERDASLRLRDGDRTVIDTYTAHGRISDGDPAAMSDAAYRAWLRDTRAGKTSLLLAPDQDSVTALNRRARLDRIRTGEVEADGVALRDGTEAGIGDRIVTRLNARRLLDTHGRCVRNGTGWTITERFADGSLNAARDTGQPGGPGESGESGGATVTLPASYVGESVELGYAATVHRAQGATVDTTHLLARAGMAREALYVGMTRGRDANHAYVATTDEQPEEHEHQPRMTAHEVLTGILGHTGVERSATETLRHELDTAGSLARLVPMHEHMAQAAAGDHWHTQLTDAGLDPGQVRQVVSSPAWPPLVAALRRAQAQGMHPARLLQASIASAGFDGAHDIAAVLHARLNARTRSAHRRGEAHAETTIAGLITPARDIADPAMAAALTDVEQLIRQRADELGRQAISDRPAWTDRLGQPADEPRARAAWQHAVTTVAAYRERHGVTSNQPLGAEPSSLDHTHARDRARAAQAVQVVAAATPAGTPNLAPAAAPAPAYAPAATRDAPTI